MTLVESILANEHVQIVLFAVIVGVALRTWAVHNDATDRTIDRQQIGLTAIISCITAIGLVMPVIEVIPDDAAAERWLVAIGSAILTVYASDSLASKVGERIGGRRPAAGTAQIATTVSVPPPEIPEFDIPEKPADDGNPPPKEAT